jgi:hypothetical protein
MRVLSLIAVPVLLVACTPSKSPDGVTIAPVTGSAKPTGSGSPIPSAAPSAAAPAGPKLCGCTLCEPLPSGDACTSDADCAPSIPCHAPACVAKAKAEPRAADQMCTQELRCGTADTAACGCVRGFCALYPKSATP